MLETQIQEKVDQALKSHKFESVLADKLSTDDITDIIEKKVNKAIASTSNKVTQIATKLDMWDTLVESKLNIIQNNLERRNKDIVSELDIKVEEAKIICDQESSRVTNVIKEMKETKLAFDSQSQQALGGLYDELANWKMIESEKNKTHREIIIKELKGDISKFFDSQLTEAIQNFQGTDDFKSLKDNVHGLINTTNGIKHSISSLTTEVKRLTGSSNSNLPRHQTRKNNRLPHIQPKDCLNQGDKCRKCDKEGYNRLFSVCKRHNYRVSNNPTQPRPTRNTQNVYRPQYAHPTNKVTTFSDAWVPNHPYQFNASTSSPSQFAFSIPSGMARQPQGPYQLHANPHFFGQYHPGSPWMM